jgi:hypothetical protein
MYAFTVGLTGEEVIEMHGTKYSPQGLLVALDDLTHRSKFSTVDLRKRRESRSRGTCGLSTTATAPLFTLNCSRSPLKFETQFCTPQPTRRAPEKSPTLFLPN